MTTGRSSHRAIEAAAIATVLPGLLAACASRTPEMYKPGYCVIVYPALRDPAIEGRVRESFIRWNRAAAEGNARACFAGISYRLKSQWLWDRLDDDRDLITRLHLRRLDPGSKTALDHWYERSPADRVHIAPSGILESRWLDYLWRDHFRRAEPAILAEAADRVVREVYADAEGATVLAHTAGRGELFRMIREDEVWEVDTRR